MAYTKVAKPTADFASHLYACLLCEDGTYLLQEDSNRINLEWYFTKIAKPVV